MVTRRPRSPSGPDTLAAVEPGVTVRLAPAGTGRPGLDAPVRLRLAELGLRPGATVSVMARTAGGGRVLGVGSGRIAVDGATAALLPVEAPPCP